MDSKSKRQLRQSRVKIAKQLTAKAGGKLIVRHHGASQFLVIQPEAIPRTWYLTDKTGEALCESLAEVCRKLAEQYANLANDLTW